MRRYAGPVAIYVTCLTGALLAGAYLIYTDQLPQFLDIPLAVALAVIAHMAALGLIDRSEDDNN